MSRTASRTAPGGLQGLGKLRIAGAVLISLVGLIHLFVTPEYYGFATYLELIYGGRIWGWILGAVMAGGAFLGYIESRTLGLRGLPSWEPFTEPPGLISLIVEAIFVGAAAYVLAWRRRVTASSNKAT